MKAISLMWTEGVTAREARTVVTAVRELIGLICANCHEVGLADPPAVIRPFGTWHIPSITVGDPYWGTQWYIDGSYDPGLRQIVAPHFLELVRDEPWQKTSPHWDVAVVDADLVDRSGHNATRDEMEFALGAVLPGIATVVSVSRLRTLPNDGARALALRRLVNHQFGHVLGLPGGRRDKAVETAFGERHCVNVCVMRHAETPEHLADLAVEEQKAGTVLCAQCARDAIEIIAMTHVSAN